MTTTLSAFLSVTGCILSFVAIIHQSIKPVIHLKDHVTATATITTNRHSTALM